MSKGTERNRAQRWRLHQADEKLRGAIRRLYVASALVVIVMGIGTAGYWVIGEGAWSWWDCFYMTVITIATVGYGETLPGLETSAWGRPWTVVQILLGSGSLVYFVSTLTAFIVEGDLQGALGRRRMNHSIDALRDHVIVCGAGTTGEHVIAELIATGTPFVVIEPSHARLAQLAEEHKGKLLYLTGDATDDELLLDAGITRARGLVTTLREDRDNVFIVLTARGIRPDLRIVARAVEPSSIKKLRTVGADAVVSPNHIGGMRLVSEMIRPAATEFFDAMLRDPARTVRVESVEVPPQAPLAGRELRRAKIREETGLLVVAVREPGGRYLYNPGPDVKIPPGGELVVLGEPEQLTRLRALLA